MLSVASILHRDATDRAMEVFESLYDSLTFW